MNEDKTIPSRFFYMKMGFNAFNPSGRLYASAMKHGLEFTAAYPFFKQGWERAQQLWENGKALKMPDFQEEDTTQRNKDRLIEFYKELKVDELLKNINLKDLFREDLNSYIKEFPLPSFEKAFPKIKKNMIVTFL